MNVAFSVWGVPPLFWFSDHLNPQPHLYFNSHLRFWKNTVAYGIKRTCIDLANKIPLCDGVRCVAPCPTLKLYGFYLWKESLRKSRGERVLTQLPTESIYRLVLTPRTQSSRRMDSRYPLILGGNELVVVNYCQKNAIGLPNFVLISQCISYYIKILSIKQEIFNFLKSHWEEKRAPRVALGVSIATPL